MRGAPAPTIVAVDELEAERPLAAVVAAGWLAVEQLVAGLLAWQAQAQPHAHDGFAFRPASDERELGGDVCHRFAQFGSDQLPDEADLVSAQFLREESDLYDVIDGEVIAEPVAAADWLRIAELVATYRDLPLGTVDASVIAAAERLGVISVATLDRRHFSVVRPLHGPFTMLP